MRDIDQILKELIPPPTYQHRNGFSNENLVLSLSDEERLKIESDLIEMLETKDDELIGETLTILKSSNSLKTLSKRLNLAKRPTSKIVWASYINEIKGGDNEMKEIALNEFDKVREKYSRIGIFHSLTRFQDARINEKIRGFINHSDYLTAYNARVSLGIDTNKIVNRERLRDKIGWLRFWKK